MGESARSRQALSEHWSSLIGTVNREGHEKRPVRRPAWDHVEDVVLGARCRAADRTEGGPRARVGSGALIIPAGPAPLRPARGAPSVSRSRVLSGWAAATRGRTLRRRGPRMRTPMVALDPQTGRATSRRPTPGRAPRRPLPSRSGRVPPTRAEVRVECFAVVPSCTACVSCSGGLRFQLRAPSSALTVGSSVDMGRSSFAGHPMRSPGELADMDSEQEEVGRGILGRGRAVCVSLAGLANDRRGHVSPDHPTAEGDAVPARHGRASTIDGAGSS